jgi:hypothetical protein
LRDRGGVPRKEIFERFLHDDENAVAAVLNDLVSSGLAYATGHGGSALYGLTTFQDRERLARQDLEEAAAAMIWLVVYREGPIDVAGLGRRLALDAAELETALGELLQEGRVRLDPSTGRYSSAAMSVAIGARMGWEAAVFDHFQAVSKAIAAKLRLGPQSREADVIGGATLSFDLDPNHPLGGEVHGLLRAVRAQVNELWHKVSVYNREHRLDDERRIKLTFYMGQNVEGPGAELTGGAAERH